MFNLSVFFYGKLLLTDFNEKLRLFLNAVYGGSILDVFLLILSCFSAAGSTLSLLFVLEKKMRWNLCYYCSDTA